MAKFLSNKVFILPSRDEAEYFKKSEELNDIIEYQNGSINDCIVNVDGSQTFFIDFYADEYLEDELEDPVMRDYLL